LQFDYKSNGSRIAAYRITYTGNDGAVAERFGDGKGKWITYSKDFIAPEGAKNVKVTLFAYPDNKNKIAGIATYDNFKLARIPNVTESFYVMSEAFSAKDDARVNAVQHSSPTEKIVSVSHAKRPFNIVIRDTYSPSWVLAAADGVNSSTHFKDVSNTNAWYIDPSSVCGRNPKNCTQNTDGSYDMKLAISYAPQKWFEVGAAVSVLTLVAVGGCVTYRTIGRKRQSKMGKIWRARV
jgi:hypothetical protein